MVSRLLTSPWSSKPHTSRISNFNTCWLQHTASPMRQNSSQPYSHPGSVASGSCPLLPLNIRSLWSSWLREHISPNQSSHSRFLVFMNPTIRPHLPRTSLLASFSHSITSSDDDDDDDEHRPCLENHIRVPPGAQRKTSVAEMGGSWWNTQCGRG